MIGDVLLECELEPGVRRTLAGFENHAGRTRLDPDAEPLGRVVAGFGNDGESGYEGCRVAARSAPTSTGRCCLATPGWPTGCCAGARPRAGRSRPRSSRSRTSWRRRRTPSPRAALASAAGVPRTRARQASPATRPVGPGFARPASRRPQGPEVDAGIAGLPAAEEPLDRRVQRDLLQLVEREEAVAAHGRVPRDDVGQRPVEVPAKMTCTTCFDQRLRSGEMESTIATGPSTGSCSRSPTTPISSASSRCSASVRLSPPRTPPPGSSQFSRPPFRAGTGGRGRASGGSPRRGREAPGASSGPTTRARASRARSAESSSTSRSRS